MNYINLLHPVIGAGIGYITNYIAVKMLFRPINEIKIKNIKIPFTPGIIPKNKKRIATSIADAINENLLTKNDFKKALLSSKSQKNLKNNINNILKSEENSNTIKETLTKYLEDENYENLIKQISKNLSNIIFEKIKEENLGNIIAQKIQEEANKKVKGVLSLFGGNNIIAQITDNVAIGINDYIIDNGQNYIEEMINKEIYKLEAKTLNELIENLQKNNISISDIAIKIYENFIINKISNILEIINIKGIIENKINEMDTLELEKIILSIMKKELNALINLGALIGFALGILNIFI